MERIITDELIRYKAGFLDGKDVILNIMEEKEEDRLLRELAGNKEIDALINNENSIFYKEDIGEESWYKYGYDDAYMYYLKQYIENGFITKDEFLRNKSDKVMQDLFVKRVIKNNKENDTKVAFSKFRM